MTPTMTSFIHTWYSNLLTIIHKNLKARIQSTEPEEHTRASSLDQENVFFTPRNLRQTLQTWTFFDKKPITAKTGSEYVKKFVVLNEIERRKLPKIHIEEPHKTDQESAPTRAEIDSTGLIRTGICRI